MSEYKTTSHCKYLCQYHLIWCPKFRFSVLENVEDSLKQIFQNIALNYQYDIIEQEIMPDHIHLFVGAKPTTAPSDMVRTLKSISAIELFKLYPSLKQFYSKCGSLWSVGKFISTIGKVSESTIKKYIQEQKGS
jgi:putative transposase